MTPDQMYDAVRRFESYVARKERLNGKEATPTRARTPKAALPTAPCYKHRFHKTTAFKAAAALRQKRRAPSRSPQAEKGLRDPRMPRKTRQGCFCQNS